MRLMARIGQNFGLEQKPIVFSYVFDFALIMIDSR